MLGSGAAALHPPSCEEDHSEHANHNVGEEHVAHGSRGPEENQRCANQGAEREQARSELAGERLTHRAPEESNSQHSEEEAESRMGQHHGGIDQVRRRPCCEIHGGDDKHGKQQTEEAWHGPCDNPLRE